MTYKIEQDKVQEIKESNKMKTSASALDTADLEHDGCLRKWWLKHIKKVPTPPTGSTTFGDVLHAVAERFLEADENGLKDGQPVNLYPDGWESPWNRFTGERSTEALSLEEQSLVKTLIESAIEEGVLMRVEGREIEVSINFTSFEDMQVTGFIDLLEPGAIRDHKTTKDMKYAKSVKRGAKESLYNNIQLMLYGYWYYTEGGYDKNEKLTISHQYYLKNVKKPRVEKREVKVDWPEVQAFFKEKICPIMELMLTYKDAEKWQDLPRPKNPSAACQRFGRCPFAKICTEQETLEVYTRKTERQLGTSKDKPAGDSKTQGDETMTKLDEIRARLAAKQGTPAPVKEIKTTTPAVQESAPNAVRQEEVVHLTQTAPWYKEGCKACTTNAIRGMNTSGVSPCRVCEVWAKEDGIPAPSDYIWEVAAGKLIVRDVEGAEVLEALTVTEPVKVKEQTKDEQKPVVPPQVPEAADVPPAVPQDEADKPAVREGEAPQVFADVDFLSERSKFRILIGCGVSESKAKNAHKFGSPNCTLTIEELLIIVESQLRTIVGEIRWGQMNTFDRKDVVYMYGKQIAESLGASTLFVARLPKASMAEAVVLAIQPYALEVIRPYAD